MVDGTTAGAGVSAPPGEAAREAVAIDGGAISYLHVGEGPPVVLVHGGGLDSAALSWRETIPALAPGFAVYALDLPGYGASAPRDEPPTVATYARVVTEFVEQLDVGPVGLVGISLGGAAALGTALDRPDLVDRLVLVDSYGLGGRLPGGWLAALSVRLPGLLDATWALLARSRRLTAWGLRAVVHPANVTPGLVDEVYDTVRAGSRSSWGAFQRSEVGFGGLRTNYRSRLSSLEVPTLFVHGEADPLVPLGWSVRGATLAPDGELIVVQRCGHWPPRERPEAFNDALRDFLD